MSKLHLRAPQSPKIQVEYEGFVPPPKRVVMIVCGHIIAPQGPKVNCFMQVDF